MKPRAVKAHGQPMAIKENKKAHKGDLGQSSVTNPKSVVPYAIPNHSTSKLETHPVLPNFQEVRTLHPQQIEPLPAPNPPLATASNVNSGPYSSISTSAMDTRGYDSANSNSALRHPSTVPQKNRDKCNAKTPGLQNIGADAPSN